MGLANSLFPQDKPEDPISLKSALKRKPKEGNHWITVVQWGDHTPQIIKEFIPSLNKTLDIWIPPTLPKGYQMEWCDNWELIENAFIEGINSARNFEHVYEIEEEYTQIQKRYRLNLSHIYDIEELKYPEGYSEYCQVKEAKEKLESLTVGQLVDRMLHHEIYYAVNQTPQITLINGNNTSDLSTLLTKVKSITFMVNTNPTINDINNDR